MTTKPDLVLILLHPIHDPISKAEAVAAIPPHLKGIPYEFAVFDTPIIPLDNLEYADLEQLHRRQRHWFETQVKPTIEKNPGCHVLYFGKSPIPTAAHLGSLISSWRPVDAMYNDHNSKIWYYDRQAQPENVVKVSDFHGSKGDGAVVIRLSTSLEVLPSATESLLPSPMAEIDIRLEWLDRDSCYGDLAKKIVTELRRVLDSVHTKYPNSSGTHFFAAAPMGLMFEIGAALTPSIHYPITFYNYFRKNSPPYRSVLTLSTEGAGQAPLTDQERLEAESSLLIWQEELARIKELAGKLPLAAAEAPCWLDQLFPGKRYSERLDGNFCAQSALRDARIVETTISPKTYDLPSDFTLDPATKTWWLGERLLHQFRAMHAGDDSILRQAIRLFLLHEAMHEERQALRQSVATNVGQMSRAVEEIDYHADVWAILHELRLEPESNVVFRAREIIYNMLGSFMAFDRAGQSNRPQVRRLNRYLIWLWQLCLVERMRADAGIHDIIKFLLNKPVLDLCGPQIVTRDNRHYMLLDSPNPPVPEMGVYFQGKFKRFQNANSAMILNGFRSFDLKLMIEGARGVLATSE